MNASLWRWPAALLLLLMFGLSLTSLRHTSPTMDEQGFLVRGLAYLRNENRYMRVGHPLGLNALNAALLAADDSVRLPTDDASWAETSFHRPAELFLWEIGNNVEHIMFLARLPTIWLGMLLAAVAGRWARKMSGRGAAGLLALALVALDPNIMAHTRLTTTDLGLTAGAALAGFTLWRFLRRPGWSAVLLAGACFGLMQNTKFTALLFVPLFGVVMLIAVLSRWRAGGTFPGRMLAMLLVYPVAAALMLWAMYGFQIGTMSDALPVLSALSGRTLPLSQYLEQLLDIGGRVLGTTNSFLLGEVSQSGWWYYFPVAFLLKTPLPALLLLLWAIVRVLRGRWPDAGDRADRYVDWAVLLIPPTGYFIISLTTDINIGYRHLLPILPFLYVFAGVAIAGRPWRASSSHPAWNKALLTGLMLWLGAVALWIYPHYLAYFNLIAGGPDNGWRALVDSNLDWGQDLAGLAEWQREAGIGPIYLSYFGEGRPEYYGLDYVGLDSFPPRLMNPQADPFYPAQPAPGVYAISATNLQGVLFEDHNQFGWFRDKEPLTRIGHSIFIYEVEETGPPVALALGGLNLRDVALPDYQELGTNDVQPGWFDPQSSLLLPAQQPAWLAIADGPVFFEELLERIAEPSASTSEYTLYRLVDEWQSQLEVDSGWQPGIGNRLLRLGDGEVELLGAQPATVSQASNGETKVSLVTAWRQLGPPRPLKIFVHLKDNDGEIVSQWDGLGGPWEGWREGDWWLHHHELILPPGVGSSRYDLVVGLYEPASGARWQDANGNDQLLVQEVVVP